MKIEDLKVHYEIKKFYDMNCDGQKRVKNQYELWSLEPVGVKFPRQFYCIVEKVGDKFKIIPDKRLKHVDKYFTFAYSRIEGLIEFVEKYVKSLQYHSDYYYPNFRPHVFIELAVGFFLKNLGFKNDYGNECDYWVLNNKNIYGGISGNISFMIYGLDIFNETDDVEIIFNINNTSWISVKCNKNVDSIIGELNNLLKPLFLTDGITNIQKSDKLEFTDFNGLIHEFNTPGLSLKSNEYKEELKEKLLQIVEQIK